MIPPIPPFSGILWWFQASTAGQSQRKQLASWWWWSEEKSGIPPKALLELIKYLGCTIISYCLLLELGDCDLKIGMMSMQLGLASKESKWKVPFTNYFWSLIFGPFWMHKYLILYHFFSNLLKRKNILFINIILFCLFGEYGVVSRWIMIGR